MALDSAAGPVGTDTPGMAARARELQQELLGETYRSTDRRLAVLTFLEWLAAIAGAMWISPLTWTGRSSSTHPHVWLAIFFGALISSLPVGLAFTLPGQRITRHSMAAGQMLMAGLLVHVTGGRIETHFSYFGLLAFLGFYRDWRVLITATVVTGLDHFLRAIFFPQSMYGVEVVSLWRALEHSGWVLFEIGVLIDFIRDSRSSMLATAWRQARLEQVSDRISNEVKARTSELEDSERRYRVMFENSPLPMWLCDAETMTFIAVNQRAIEKYGYTRDEFMKMRSFEIRPKEDVERFKLFLQNLPDEPAPMRQWRHQKKDGSVMDVEVTSHPVEWGGRRAQMVLANDISDRRNAERERTAMEVQLRHAQKMESIGQLAAGIAHEINTPTQFIGDNLQFLKDSFAELQAVVAMQEKVLPHLVERPPDEPGLEGSEWTGDGLAALRATIEAADTPYLMNQIPRALDQAIDGVTRVSTLVKAMKEFSHPGGKEKAAASLNDAVRSTVTVARNEWKYVAEMALDLDPELPAVPCLASELNQVLLNLIVNAAHAIAAVDGQGQLGTITIRTRLGLDYAEIQVEDTGTGIPEEVRHHIFEPFFTTKEVGKGTGQGLAIAHSVIVEKHKGTIHCETEIGKGTTFVIRLPLEEVPVDEAEPEAAEVAVHAE